MDREKLFTKTLEKLREKAKEQGNCISEEQIETAFWQLGLSEEQFALVRKYLKNERVGVGEPANIDDYLTPGEVNYLEYYLNQFLSFAEMSEGEKEAVTLSAMAGDETAQTKLSEMFLPKVVEIAKLYTGQGVYLEDLIGEGNLALALGVTLLGCLENAHEAHGMLGKMIMDAMEELIDGNQQEGEIDKKLLSKVNKVADKAQELSESLQKKVTIRELSEETGLSKEDIIDAIRISGDNIEYIESATIK